MKVDVFEKIKRLNNTIKQEEEHKEEWKKKYYELDKKYKELEKEKEKIEKELNQLKNPNTPSSQIPVYLRNYSAERKAKGSSPRGKPQGSKGGGRKRPIKHDDILEAKATECPDCKSTNIIESPEEKTEFTVFEIPEVQMQKRKAILHQYFCKECKNKFEGRHPEIPTKGQIGPRLQAMIGILKNEFGASVGKISDFTHDVLKDRLSPVTINEALKNISSVLTPSYNHIKEEIKNEPVKKTDETGWPVNGENWWAWVVTTLSFVFVMIDEGRGSDVLKKIFGVAEDFVGVLVSDCYSAYHAFQVVSQKCWSHLLRKAKFEALKKPKEDIYVLYRRLGEIYNSIQDSMQANPSQSERIWASIMYHQKLKNLVNENWKNKDSILLCNRIKRYMHQWLVGIIIPEVPLHNNDSERSIKSLILQRKVCGGHRTLNGANNFAIIASHMQTWKLRKESQFEQLHNFLRKSYASYNSVLI
ncbi:MAG: IS66 family transposase [archaeon]